MSSDPKHKEGITVSNDDEGNQHVTIWYDNGQGSSARVSTDYDKNDNESNKHVTVQKSDNDNNNDDDNDD